MVFIGLDIGSVAAKGVLLTGESRHRLLLPTGWSPGETGKNLIEGLLRQSGLRRSDVKRVVATGYGRVALREADRTVTEISCHARGVAAAYPDAGTVIDIGGQDSKVISIGRGGKVLNFAMNDKCAAGTGRFLQVMAAALDMDIGELGEAEDPSQDVTINSMCTVFAESEIVGLLACGISRGGIIAGLHRSVGRRVAAMARRLGVRERVVLSGGVALNRGVYRALQEELRWSVTVADDCLFSGAAGAALLAGEMD